MIARMPASTRKKEVPQATAMRTSGAAAPSAPSLGQVLHAEDVDGQKPSSSLARSSSAAVENVSAPVLRRLALRVALCLSSSIGSAARSPNVSFRSAAAPAKVPVEKLPAEVGC